MVNKYMRWIKFGFLFLSYKENEQREFIFQKNQYKNKTKKLTTNLPQKSRSGSEYSESVSRRRRRRCWLIVNFFFPEDLGSRLALRYPLNDDFRITISKIAWAVWEKQKIWSPVEVSVVVGFKDDLWVWKIGSLN